MRDLSSYDDPAVLPAGHRGLRRLSLLRAASSSRWRPGCPRLGVQRRVHLRWGQRTYNLMVDLTNYVMSKLGQPTHAFDADRVHAIRVARIGQEGTFVTLDGQQRKMLPDDLLIWNEDQPVALAGIMGGLYSEVEPQTSRVLLEERELQGLADPPHVGPARPALESARRFREEPAAGQREAGHRARMLQLIADAEVALRDNQTALTYDGDLKEGYRTLVLEPAVLERLAGAEVAAGRGDGDPPGPRWASRSMRTPTAGLMSASRRTAVKKTSRSRPTLSRRCCGSTATARSGRSCPSLRASRRGPTNRSAASTGPSGWWPGGARFPQGAELRLDRRSLAGEAWLYALAADRDAEPARQGETPPADHAAAQPVGPGAAEPAESRQLPPVRGGPGLLVEPGKPGVAAWANGRRLS